MTAGNRVYPGLIPPTRISPHKALRRCALRKNTRPRGLEVLKGPLGTAEIGSRSDPCGFPCPEPLQGLGRVEIEDEFEDDYD